MMNYDCAVKGENISKKFKTFTLDIPDLRVPKGLRQHSSEKMERERRHFSICFQE